MTQNNSIEEKLKNVNLINTAASSVPSSIFVTYPNETFFDHSLFLDINFTASKDLLFITSLQKFSEELDIKISKIYSHRSIGGPLQRHLKNSKETTYKLSNKTLQYIDPLLKLILISKNSINEIGNCLKDILIYMNSKPGNYSDLLFIYISNIIYKITTFDEILNGKKSISHDLKTFTGYLTSEDGSSKQKDILEADKWLEESNRIRNQLFNILNTLNNESKKQIYIIWNYLQNILQNKSFIQPNLKYSLINLSLFLSSFSPQIILTNPNDQNFLKFLIESISFLPLYHEVSLNIIDYLKNVEIIKNMNFIFKNSSPSIELNKLRSDFSTTSRKIALLISFPTKIEENYQDIINSISNAFTLINYTKGLLREQYVEILSKEYPNNIEMKKFEYAIREGYSNTDLKVALQLLALCRELHDLLREKSPKLIKMLNESIHYSFQKFIKHGLAKCYSKMKGHKEILGNLYQNIRNLAGDFLKTENPSMTVKQTTKPEEHKITERKASPSPQLIELIRIQMQHITNNESEYKIPSTGLFKTGFAYREKEEKLLKLFILESFNWNDLLSFDQSLSLAADQSDFYFKEVQLDQNNVVQFPIKASLPYKLCQFALDNYVQPELTELIFYPLSIYDDAAFASIHKHKSKLMFTEIQAEAQVCLTTLSNLISEFCFNAFRIFASLCQVPEKVIENLKKTHSKHWPVSHAYRLRTLLQQNQYYLLSKQITLKSLIAPRVDLHVNESVKELYALSKDFGIVSSLAISHGLDALRDTHKLLLDQGLSLMPFIDIERTAKKDNYPLAFNNEYFDNTLRHIFKTLIPKFSLSINPHRFHPPKPIQLSQEPLGKYQLGKILSDALLPSVTFVSMGHFSFFIRQISDGAFSLIADRIKSRVTQIFNDFTEHFHIFSTRISRIKDAPYSTPANQTFERYDNAYKHLCTDETVSNLLKSLMSFGNLLMVCEMLDKAYIMKQFSISHYIRFLRSFDENNKPRDEIETFFDDNFKKSIQFLKNKTSNICQYSQGLMMSVALNTFIELLQDKLSLLLENSIQSKSPILPSVNSMSGFASIWSIIEFIYCQMESTREPVKEDENSLPPQEGFIKYGNGVFLAASIIALATNQVSLIKLLSIGHKLEMAYEIDQSGSLADKLIRFLSVYKYGETIYEWGLLFFSQHVSNSQNNLLKKLKK